VYVDGALHPERPIVVEQENGARLVRVEAAGFEPWEERIAINSDISLEIALQESGSEVRKVTRKTSAKKAHEPKTSRIDTSYPGLQ
jgi:hypothetical protein